VGLTRFYIYIKHTSLYRFVHNGFNTHWVRTSSSNWIRYERIM